MQAEDLNLQEKLSLAYLSLVVIGLLDNIFHYKILGINIIDYITISDVLLSPLATLTNNSQTFMSFFLVATLSVGFMYSLPVLHKKYQNKRWYRFLVRNSEDMDKLANVNSHQRILHLQSFLAGVFIGVSAMFSFLVKNDIERGDYQMTHQIVFSNTQYTPIKIYMIGKNSGYIFYVLEGNPKIHIMPINDNLLVLEQL